MGITIPINFQYYFGQALYHLTCWIIEKSTKLSHCYFQSSQGKISYLTGNKANKPILLFIHGFSGNKELWLNTAFSLRNTHSLILLDLFGHGTSDRPENKDYSIEAHAQMITELLNNKGIKNFSIIGSSMGCAIASSLALNNHFTIDFVMFINPFGVTKDQIRDLRYFRAGTKEPFIVHSVEEYYDFFDIIVQKSKFMPTCVKYYLAIEHIKYSAHIAEMFEVLMKTNEYLPSLKNKKFPLVVLAGQDDSVVDIHCYNKLVNQLDDCQLHWLEGLGHLPMLENPKLIAAKIQSLLPL